MWGSFWAGLVNLASGLTTTTLFGLDTASSQGADWSSADSLSAGE